MTTKTIKTILFAALFVAFMLPIATMTGNIENVFADVKKDSNTPLPETAEEALKDHLRHQNASRLGIQTIGLGNKINTMEEPLPMKRTGPGENPQILVPAPGSGTDNWYGSHLDKLTSSINGVYAKSEVHDNGYTLADGTTLYAPTMMGPGNSSLEIVTAYYNPTGTTWDTLDKLFVYDFVTGNFEYSVPIDSTFLSKYTSGSNHYFAEVIDTSGTWYAKIYNFQTSTWDTLHSQSSDYTGRTDGWYIWEEDSFSSGCPTVHPEIEGDLLKVNYNGNWQLATSTYSSIYDTGLPCSFSGTWDSNYYNWRVN